MLRTHTATNIDEASAAPTPYQRCRLRQYLEVEGCRKASIAHRENGVPTGSRVVPEDDEIVHVMATGSYGGWARSSELRVGKNITTKSILEMR